jgi:RimJ/RimL family protein N-acetyltransferase
MTSDSKSKLQFISGELIDLRLCEIEDAAFICSLRSDPELNRFLSPSSNVTSDQEAWIIKYKEREAAQQEFYYIILDKAGEPVGCVRLYDFQGISFSWGSWILNKKAPRRAALESAVIVYEIGFEELGFKKCHFDVRKDNLRVHAFHRRFGASKVSENSLDIFYNYSHDKFLSVKEKYLKAL